MKTPERVTLSASEGEAIMARLAAYAPSRSDCEICIQVIRLYFWLAAVVDEAKVSMKKLRTLLFGRVVQPPKADDLKAASVGTPAFEAGEAAAWDEEVGQGGEAGSKLGSSEPVFASM